MTVSAEQWAITQAETFKTRRHFFRDILFDRILRSIFWDVTITGLENIPERGAGIIMINHTAAPDPVVALGAVRPRFVVPMSKIENFWNPFVGLVARTWGAFPIRRGEVDRQALMTAISLLKADQLLLMAPEGTRQPALTRPKDGLAYVATKADPVIIPTAIYNMEGWNRDMLIPWRHTPIHITFGRGFRLRTEGRRRIPREDLHQMTDEMMYQLATLLPERNRGDYGDLDKLTTDTLDFV